MLIYLIGFGFTGLLENQKKLDILSTFSIVSFLLSEQQMLKSSIHNTMFDYVEFTSEM